MIKYTYVRHLHGRGARHSLYKGEYSLSSPLIAEITGKDLGYVVQTPASFPLTPISDEVVKVLDYYDEGLNELVPERAAEYWRFFAKLHDTLTQVR